MDWKLFFSTYSLIFLAELPDKTALATLLMAARGRPWPIFAGVAVAFLVQSLIAVSFGTIIGNFPEKWVHLGAGLLFIFFGFLEWRKSLEHEAEESSAEISAQGLQGFWRSAWSAFLVIFVAEWGDLTQLATATLAAREASPITIFFSATLALWSVTLLAIVLGRFAKKFIHQKFLQRFAALVFLGLGLYFLWKR